MIILRNILIEILLKNKADPNLKDTVDETSPFLALIKSNPSLSLVELLLKNGAIVNSVDSSKRNGLMYLTNADNGTKTMFDVEYALIDAGIDVNAIDIRGKSALHYSFVKIGSNNTFVNSKIDPIEIVSCLSSLNNIDIDIVDSFGKTPLSYASQRGSIVCALYLLERGAMLERIDKDGNTPLGLSLMK